MNKNKNMNIVVIIQARMGSSRLRGKVLADISGKPMLWHIVNRLYKCVFVNKVVVATSNEAQDDAIADLCGNYLIDVFRGSEKDVLKRYYDTAVKYGADVVVRITGDCPLIDPRITDTVISAYMNNTVDYAGASNTIKRSYPRGLDTEVISFSSLEKCHRLADKPYEREHVTIFLYEHPDEFRMYSVENDRDFSSLRWTVDEEEDLRLVTDIYKRLFKKDNIFYMEDIIRILEKEFALNEINKSVRQKDIG